MRLHASSLLQAQRLQARPAGAAAHFGGPTAVRASGASQRQQRVVAHSTKAVDVQVGTIARAAAHEARPTRAPRGVRCAEAPLGREDVPNAHTLQDHGDMATGWKVNPERRVSRVRCVRAWGHPPIGRR